jgi:hypothetical protein
MNKTVEVPNGKIIDLNRFVALVPDEKSANQEYHLILEGYEQAIALSLFCLNGISTSMFPIVDPLRPLYNAVWQYRSKHF